MTIQEFHINFDIELDKSLDFEYPYIQPETKDYWLNKAQDRFISSRAYPNNDKADGFEQSQKRIDDLRTVVKMSDPITPTVSGDIYKSALPEDYQHLIRHWCKTTDPICGSKTSGGVQVQQDDLNIMKRDPFWKPIAEEPLYYIIGGAIIYETNGEFVINETNISYIKKPLYMKFGDAYSVPEANVQCELPDHVHNEILDIAVNMVLENIESPRYQTSLNELNKSD